MIDERLNESGTYTAVRHWTPSPFYRRASVSCLAAVAAAAASRHALDHMGRFPRARRDGSRVVTWRPTLHAPRHRFGGSRADRSPPRATHALADTNRMIAAYDYDIERADQPSIRVLPNAGRPARSTASSRYPVGIDC
jgi:hypothetical protein